jgi:hypothetical protein
MEGKIIIAPVYTDIKGPLIFLAGPIQGAYQWQRQAVKYIHQKAPEINIANPRRDVKIKGEFTTEMYNEQVDWETDHLKKAGKKGAILFWQAKEFEHACYRAYAQTSRFELSEWKIKHQTDPSIKLAIGLEEGFTGSKYIRRRMSQDCPEIPILSSLEETCEQAIKLVRE